MRTTRREALFWAASAACQAATAQEVAGQLTVTNPLGIRIQPFRDGKIPAVSVFLPGNETRFAAVVEMPEHAWRKKMKADGPEGFYSMYSWDERMKAVPLWSREGNALAYRMDLPAGFTLNARATLDSDGLEIAYRIDNPGPMAYAEVQAPTCVKLYRPFTDIFLERTYVHHPDGLDLVASGTPERLGQNAEEWLPSRYIVRCSREAPLPPQWVEKRSDNVTRYHKIWAADTPFIATESSPEGWVAATHSLTSPEVWTNPARTCHHADSGAPLDANSVARLAVKLHLLRGGASDAWARVAERQASHQL
jgi:hypothetical protein